MLEMLMMYNIFLQKEILDGIQELENTAKRHREVLNDLFNDENRPTFEQDDVTSLRAVNTQFLKKWRLFVK